ncbi:uncharacterized protein LOC114311316 isoform X2 [Camellia sinensis]|uniref:uncharacterized protein LOC114311316 isoform X2 n=1 Tax=Camellia sinensis TaxID=4442 RepID=UPI0010368554|nr:uncharacterized protein LOC114311316 isoform X2 [Camellia sinensis]
MGKAARFFRGLLGLKKEEPRPPAKQPKRRWSFGKSHREKDLSTANNAASPGFDAGDGDPSKHAIAVAAATAAVAEAAVAAAQAAAAVVRLTSSGRSNNGVVNGNHVSAAYVSGNGCEIQEEWAVVRIQAYFRGYLGPATPEKFEHTLRSKSTKHDHSPMLKRNGSKSIGQVIIDQDKANNSWDCLDLDEGTGDQRGPSMKTSQLDDEKSDKILEVDTGKPHFAPKRKNLYPSSHHASASDQYSHSFSASKDSTTHQTVPSPSSCEVQSLSPLEFPQDVEESPFCTAGNSPQFYSASSRGGSSKGGPFTPSKSDGSRSYLSGYSDHPNYMACTQSSRAKIRSLSAPKQRPQLEGSVPTKRYLVNLLDDSSSSTQRVSVLHANFTNKAYPGSGRLDRLGMPMRGDMVGLNAGNWNRY